MFEFHYYNPEQPRIITSFKGNQKLILGGYRYNIHHVKDGVNNKTWRCVCAKKLTGARSWCKGRAETWEGDTKGIPKGEHNHQTEHDLAELEYFKSQLIFAAISEPTTDLNLLIDEATKFLSPGLSFGNRESMKKSLIVARKSAESGELVLGQLPYRSKKSVKRASVRSKAAAVSKSGPQIKNLATSTPSIILPQSSQSTSRQRSTPNNRTSTGSYSPFSPNISIGSRSNNSSGIGSSLSSSDCLDTSLFSSMGPNTQQNSWNQNSHFEMPSISALNNTFTEGVEASSSSINPYGTVNMTMPSEILAAALYAVAMLGSAQASQNQSQQNQQLQEAVNNSTLPIPSKRTRVNNNSITNRATTNGASPMRAITPLTNSVARSTTATEGINLKRKGARVNGILQKLSTKAAAVSTSPPAPTTPMELIGNEMSKCPNTVAIKEEKEELNPMAQKGLLVSVQTQTDNMNEMGLKRYTTEDKMNGNNNSAENGRAKLNGFMNHPPKRLICCCCFDEVEGLNVDEFPVGCKKRAKLLLENGEQCDKDLNKSSTPPSNIRNKEDREEKQNEENNNVSGIELFESDNELKLEIEEEDDEDN